MGGDAPNKTHTRFSNAEWYGEQEVLTIGGVGTIGSWTALLLSRLGDHEIVMYDNDVVDIENLAGQIYSKNQIGMTKVDAMRSMILDFTDLNAQKAIALKELFNGKNFVSPFVFSCFDNMEARKLMFEAWKAKPNRELFIDGRMTMESYEVYAVSPGMEERYEETLFDSATIEDQICSLKSTSHTGALIAGRMVSLFTNYLSNRKMGIDIRVIPFKVREEMSMQLIELER